MLELVLANIACNRKTTFVIRHDALICDPKIRLLANGTCYMLKVNSFALETIYVGTHIVVPIPKVHLFAYRTGHDIKEPLACGAENLLPEKERRLCCYDIFANAFDCISLFLAMRNRTTKVLKNWVGRLETTRFVNIYECLTTGTLKLELCWFRVHFG